MLNVWSPITNELYSYKIERNNIAHSFTLKLQKIGVYGYGRPWVLRGKLLDDTAEVIASFWTKDDGYQGYESKGYNKKLWNDSTAKSEAINIINNLVENMY